MRKRGWEVEERERERGGEGVRGRGRERSRGSPGRGRNEGGCSGRESYVYKRTEFKYLLSSVCIVQANKPLPSFVVSQNHLHFMVITHKAIICCMESRGPCLCVGCGVRSCALHMIFLCHIRVHQSKRRLPVVFLLFALWNGQFHIFMFCWHYQRKNKTRTRNVPPCSAGVRDSTKYSATCE